MIIVYVNCEFENTAEFDVYLYNNDVICCEHLDYKIHNRATSASCQFVLSSFDDVSSFTMIMMAYSTHPSW